jgi:hypothetical protein
MKSLQRNLDMPEGGRTVRRERLQQSRPKVRSRALLAPKGTPKDVIGKLNAAVVKL